MDFRFFAEVAALVSAHSTHVIESPQRLPDEALQRFWHHSKQRLHHWTRQLDFRGNEIPIPLLHDVSAPANLKEAVLEDIFISEMLTRVWAAVLVSTDRKQKRVLAEPIARNVMVGQLEARYRALRKLVEVSNDSFKEFTRTDRLRRRVERWTDVLLGHLVYRYNVGEFAFDEDRAWEFGREQISQGLTSSGSPLWNLILAGLRLAFPKTARNPGDSCPDHAEIIRSITACFPNDAFTSEGPFRTLLATRIRRSSLLPEGPGEHPKPAPNRRRRRLSQGKFSNSSVSKPKGISFAQLRRRIEFGR